jgi:hypothetical protein
MKTATMLPGNDTGGRLPFEGSAEIAAIVEALIARWYVSTFVETGTQRGATALWATGHDIRVITMEADAERYAEAVENLKTSGAFLLLGDSGALIDALHFRWGEHVLFFLDAHGGRIGGTPIRAELRAIRAAVEKYNITPIICIHDFQVPDHPELGYDQYDDGTALTLPYIQPALNAMGIGAWPVRYNATADGAARGFCYIAPE